MYIDRTANPGANLLAIGIGRTADDPFFVGHRLAALRQREAITPDQQAAALGLSLGGLAYLSLCRMPRPGEGDAVARIAERAGMTLERLAELLGV